MNKILLSISLVLFYGILMAQSSNDRRGFKGSITSELIQTVKTDGRSETTSDEKVTTEIRFTGRTLVIGGDTYEIIKRAFDGKKTTLFTCTKRRATYEISYLPGDRIKVVDLGNDKIATIYRNLKE